MAGMEVYKLKLNVFIPFPRTLGWVGKVLSRLTGLKSPSGAQGFPVVPSGITDLEQNLV
jgi:hypothetical protein